MGESFLYTWEDVDAPVLNTSAGSMTALLQAVLVDGYGSKPGLGWVEYFSGTNKKVFQNKGTETLVQFDHSQEANRVYVRGYESMTDIDTGVLPCPSFAFTTNYILLKTAATNPANVVPWRILGDDKGVWIVVCPAYADAGGYGTTWTGMWKLWYIGDYIPFDLTNIHHNFCYLSAHGSTGNANHDVWTLSGFKGLADTYWARRNADLYPGAILLGMGSGSSYETAALGLTHDICDSDSEIQLTSIPTIHSATALLGRLPGLKNSLSAATGTLSPTTYAWLETVRPELVFDQGDYKEHFWRVGHTTAHSAMYIVMTEGKGFRNAI